MNETGLRRASGQELGSERPDDPRDDWLDVSDDDWDEGVSASARSTPPAPRQAWVHEEAPASPRAGRSAEADRSDFTRRRVVAGLALVALAGLYLAWFGATPSPWAAWLVFALPPAALAVAGLRGWRQAGFWAGVLALGWFSHGIMVAWTRAPDAEYVVSMIWLLYRFGLCAKPGRSRLNLRWTEASLSSSTKKA